PGSLRAARSRLILSSCCATSKFKLLSSGWRRNSAGTIYERRTYDMHREIGTLNSAAVKSLEDFPQENLDRPIIAHFEEAARRYPNRIAVTDSDTSLSYAELWDGLCG